MEKLKDEFQLLRWELPRYNELSNDFQLVPGDILYLQPKRDKAEPGKRIIQLLREIQCIRYLSGLELSLKSFTR